LQQGVRKSAASPDIVQDISRFSKVSASYKASRARGWRATIWEGEVLGLQEMVKIGFTYRYVLNNSGVPSYLSLIHDVAPYCMQKMPAKKIVYQPKFS
jgi:hypothetical protein